MRFLLIFLLSPLAVFAAEVSDADRIEQGRALVQKYSAQVGATAANPRGTGAVNLGNDSPSLKQFVFTKESQKEFVDLATGKKTLAQVNNKKKFDLMIFVSFSLSDDALKQYSKQAAEYGGVLVLRGMHKNSLEETKMRAYPVNPTGVEWDIAPATFKKFKIDRVPSIVLADATVNSVLEDGCAKESDYLRVDGDVSVHHALVLMKQYGKGALVGTAEALLESEKN